MICFYLLYVYNTLFLFLFCLSFYVYFYFFFFGHYPLESFNITIIYVRILCAVKRSEDKAMYNASYDDAVCTISYQMCKPLCVKAATSHIYGHTVHPLCINSSRIYRRVSTLQKPAAPSTPGRYGVQDVPTGHVTSVPVVHLSAAMHVKKLVVLAGSAT